MGHPAPSAADLGRLRALTGRLLDSPENLPISLTYDAQQVHGLPAAWHPTVRLHRGDSTVAETRFEAHAPGGLQVTVEVTRYLDHPAVEWVAWLRNTGNAATPLVEDLVAIDTVLAGASPTLVRWNGDYNSPDGYEPTSLRMAEGVEVETAPVGGRPCDQAFPYFRILGEDAGLALAVGWPGQWSASFRGTAEGVQVRAGQQRTHLRLEPGEAIRTPRITVLAWEGDEERGINLWRRWYRAHILPRTLETPMRPVLSASTTDEGEEYTGATEENQVRYIRQYAHTGLEPDVWWIDAGWYPCTSEDGTRRWPRTGSWEADPERFPNGLAPVGKAAADAGMDFLLWFEPERVTPGSRLDREHPEWLLRVQALEPGTSRHQAISALLNLGDPACRTWLTNHVCDFIQQNGVRVYRQDFNFQPLPYWEANDTADRQGMSENLHVQGYLRFWDDILARNPGVWIDSCASGGRRNDLETMRRSVPLHFTDYGYGFHRIKLAFHHTLFSWIPYFRESTNSWSEPAEAGGERHHDPQDAFAYHCGFAAMLTPSVSMRRQDNDLALARRMTSIWRRAAPMLVEGDYYPLTPFSKSAAEWVAWQFDRPEAGEGFVQAIRLQEAPLEELVARLHSLDPHALYLLDDPESGEHRELTGAALRDGALTVVQPKRSGRVWFYRKAAER